MEKDKHKTVVVFRKFKNGQVIALFPDFINYPDGNCESYMHIGQHSAADYNHCMTITTATTDKEHRELRQELENRGYNLKVQKRYTRKK